MKYYMISFDRQPFGQYRQFHDEFVKDSRVKTWSHHVQSSYVVGTEATARELSEHFRSTAKKFDLPTRHLVVRVNLRDCAGWMPKRAWEWIRKQWGEL